MNKPQTAHPNWTILGIGGVIVIVLLGFLLKGLTINPTLIDSPLIAKPAPAFELPRLSDGKMVSIESLRGKPTVLNFWATWCASCPWEHEKVMVPAARYFGESVQFVGIAYNDRNEAITSWLEHSGGATFPTLVDVNGKAAIAFGVYGVPETYVIDKDGIVRFKHTGIAPSMELKTQIESLL